MPCGRSTFIPGHNNHLLRRFKPADFAAIGPLELLNITTADLADRPRVLFIETGIVSVLAGSGRSRAGITIVGREGVVGLDNSLPGAHFDLTVLGAVTAYEADPRRIRARMADDGLFRTVLMDYYSALLAQVAFAKLASSTASVEGQVAALLLMVSDRSDARFRFTHEWAAGMLGVRRSGVTVAVQALEETRCIRATRGSIEVIDRKRLIAATRGAYQPWTDAA